MTLRVVVLFAGLWLMLSGCERGAPRSGAAVVATDSGPRVTAPARDVTLPPVDAGPRVVLYVRLRNVGPTPLRILTNPDVNEMIHAFRVNVSSTASDRAALLAGGARVKLFAVGQMTLCGSDAGGGYGGLGQPGHTVLAPDESLELGRWDGVIREEINDPAQGVCQRLSEATPGRYRLQFDQPQLSGAPVCTRVLATFPTVGDGGAPVLEFRCRAFVPDAGPRAPAQGPA